MNEFNLFKGSNKIRTAKEWAEITVRDLERRKREKIRGEYAAKSFLVEHKIRENKKLSRIRCRCYK